MKRLITALFAIALVCAPAHAERGRDIVKGSTDQTTYIRIVDSTDGTPETGVTSATGGLDLEYVRLGAAPADLTESDLASASAAHSDGGVFHVGGGIYRMDLPDAAVATGVNGVIVQGTATGMVVIPTNHQLTDTNPYDAVRGGMTALPNAAADAAGGLVISDAGGFDIDNRSLAAAAVTNANTVFDTDFATNYNATADTWNASVTHWLGTAAATPTVAGVPEVDVTHWLGTAAATPTVAGVPEVDITHLLGTAWLTPGTAGTPDVNVRLWHGTTIAGVDTAGYPKVTIKDGTGTGEIDTSSGKVALTTAEHALIAGEAGHVVVGDIGGAVLDTGGEIGQAGYWVRLVGTVSSSNDAYNGMYFVIYDDGEPERTGVGRIIDTVADPPNETYIKLDSSIASVVGTIDGDPVWKIVADAPSQLVADAVNSTSIASNAITDAKIAADAIGASEMAADAIASSELATTAVDEIQSNLATNGVGLIVNAITSAKITDGALVAAEFGDDFLTADKVAADAGTEFRTGLSTFNAATDHVLANAVKWAGTDTTTDNVAIKHILAKGTDITGFNDPTAAVNASAVRTELTEELDLIDAAISSRHAAGAAVASVTGSVGSVIDPTSIWNSLTSGMSAAGSIGKQIVDNLNAKVGDRPTQAYFDALFEGAPTFMAAMDSQGYTIDRADNLDNLDMPVSEVRAQAPALLVSTSIDTLSSQTTFSLSAGPQDDGALNGALIVITDSADDSRKAVALVKDYDGPTRTVTLVTDPAIFSMADGDKVDAIATGSPAALWLGGP